MFCQFQKNCELPFFWDYEKKQRSVSSKKSVNCYFLELCEKYSSGKFQSKQLHMHYPTLYSFNNSIAFTNNTILQQKVLRFLRDF